MVGDRGQHVLVCHRHGKALPAAGSRLTNQTSEAPPHRWPHSIGLPTNRWHRRPASRNRLARPVPPTAEVRPQALQQGAQALVAPHHVGQCGPQRLDMQAPAQPHRRPACCKPRTAHTAGRGTTTGVWANDNGSTAGRSPATNGSSPPSTSNTDTGRQLGNRGRLEQNAYRKVGFHRFISRGDHAHSRE